MNQDLSNNAVLFHQQRIGIDIIVWLLLIAALIFGVFYILKKYVIPFLNSVKAVNKAKLLLYRIEVLIWAIYTLFALTQLLTDSFWITMGILLVAAAAGYSFWKNFFPGLLFKLENKFTLNEPIRFEAYSGVVHALGNAHLEIKTEEEELVYISYHKLLNKTFLKRRTKGKLLSGKITVNIRNENEESAINLINQWVYECPWAVPETDNIVSIQSAGLINITFYAVDTASLMKIEQYLKHKLSVL